MPAIISKTFIILKAKVDISFDPVACATGYRIYQILDDSEEEEPEYIGESDDSEEDSLNSSDIAREQEEYECIGYR